LVVKIQKKIELLKEQRISLINQCVTKGLDPNVEMKDSGVEWIGEIPKHWEVKKIKHISNVELSSVDRHEHDDEKRVNICHYPDVYKNEYINSDTILPMGTCSDKEYENFHLRKGDILLTKDSESPEDIGIPTLVLEDLENTVCGYHLAIVRMSFTEYCSEYIYRFIESKNVKDYFYISSSGITRFGLGKGSIENLSILKSPQDEQIEIADKISRISLTTSKISDRLLNRINLLKEYRQSLISSAVTGKVRVTEDMM
jgi:type I restriction enzyme, S subunit